jgi:putative transposase
VRYAFIDGQSDAYPTESLCKAMMVSPSGYANWKARSHGAKPGGKRLSDDHLLTLIRAIHARTKGAYGSPRIYDELKDADHPVGKRRVERLMREHGLKARHKRRFKATTDSKHSLPVAPNVLDRKFMPSVPNAAWVADITYISTAEGWLYLAVVIDLYDRAVVGWSIRPRMTADIVIDALTMASGRPGPAGNRPAGHGSDSPPQRRVISVDGVKQSHRRLAFEFDRIKPATTPALRPADAQATAGRSS